MLCRGQKHFAVLKHSHLSFRGALIYGYRAEEKQTRVDAARNLRLFSQSPQADDDKDTDKPIKFSTSNASHRVWSVDRSLGIKHQRPWWKVLPLSLFGVCFMLWCVFRKESQIDKKLERELDEYFPGILSDECDTGEDDETRPDT